MQQLTNPPLDALCRPLLDFWDQRDIALDREVREQTYVLNDIADHTAQADDIPFCSRAASLDTNLAFTGGKQVIYQLQRRGFAGAAPPEENQCLPVEDLKVEIRQKFATPIKTIGNIAKLDSRIVGTGIIHGLLGA